MRRIALTEILLLMLVITSCKKHDIINNQPLQTVEQLSLSNQNKHIKIAIISDLHYLHPSLLHANAQTGDPFQNAIMHTPVVTFSVPIISKVISTLVSEHPDMVLIPGNLAFNGEKIGHQAIADSLKRLRAAGIKVYIAPGRYDINNPKAAEYFADHSSPVAGISVSDFKSIYKDFGYDNTTVIARDSNSLSYVVQPFPDLRIISIDAVKYAPYAVSGRILPQTITWIASQVAEAKEKNITVLGMMSHSLIQHLQDQNKFRPNTLIENSESTADALINAGLRVMLTGTLHSTDITMRQMDNKVLYDVSTGSLASVPAQYRLLEMKNKELDMNTQLVTSIDAVLPGNISFTQYSDSLFNSLMTRLFTASASARMGSPARLLPISIPVTERAMLAHFAGDEKLSPSELQKINAYGAESPDSTKVAVQVIMNLWTDFEPKDVKWHIKMVP